MKFNNKFVVVTGASTGIGRAIAVEFGKQGAMVGLVARRKNELEKTKEMVEKVGGEAEIFVADLSNLASVNNLIKDIKAKNDRLSGLINVAGIWHGESEIFAGKDLESFNQKTILDTYMVGFTAPTLLVHGLIEQLSLGKGKVLNISGTFENGAKGWLPYYTSKRGLEDLTVGLSEELKRLAIDVNCISPSDVATEEYKKYFPEDAQDALPPVEIAKEAMRLCSNLSDGITGKVFVVKKDQKTFEKFHA